MKYHTLVFGLLFVGFSVLFNYNTRTAEANLFEDIIEKFAQTEEDTEWTRSTYAEFVPSAGDYFMVDVTNGIGYLINDSTLIYTGFPVMTGGKSTPTPYKEWVVLEKNIQSNRIFFSESGEFFRMFENGTKRTGYGIHGYAYFTEEIEKGRKFLSWGCVMVADDVLDIIEESYIANGNLLEVSTRESVDIFGYLEGAAE